MSRRRKHAHEEHENHERWLVSYADFMTLLFAFFVVMYAVSRVEEKRLVEVTESIRWALHFEGTGGVRKLPIFTGPPSEGGCVTRTGTGPVSTPQLTNVVEPVRRRLEQRLKPFLTKRGEAASVTIVAENGRLAIRMSSGRFFDPGHSALRPEALALVDVIARELKALGRPLRVEGHTDAVPTTGGRFRNNWDLSAARAVTVVSYLEDAHAFPPALLAAEGLGSSRPLREEVSEEARAENRRIELVVELDERGELLPVR